MNTAQQSSQSFCARPGCHYAKLMHGRLAGACANYIQPGSKEAHALLREASTVVGAEPVDSSLLDRVLMAGALEHLQGRIKQATKSLQAGLQAQRLGLLAMSEVHYVAALKALGGLGAS